MLCEKSIEDLKCTLLGDFDDVVVVLLRSLKRTSEK